MQRCTVLIKMVGSKVWICSWMMSVCTAASLKALQNQSTHNSHGCSTSCSVAGYPTCAACPGGRRRICRGEMPPCLACGTERAGEGGHTQQGQVEPAQPCPHCPARCAGSGRDGGRAGEPSLQLQPVKDSSGLPVPRKANGALSSRRGQPGHPFEVPKHPGVPTQPAAWGTEGIIAP